MSTRTWWVAGILILGALLLGGAGIARADPPTPTPPSTSGYSWGDCHGGVGGALLDPVTLERVAKLLGTTASDLTTQLTSGKTLADVAKEKGATQDRLVDTIIAFDKDALALRVTYGYLNQAQADWELQRLRAEANAIITYPGLAAPGYGWGMGGWGMGGMMGGGMMGSGMMGGGMMGGWGGYPSGSTSPSTPSPGSYGGGTPSTTSPWGALGGALGSLFGSGRGAGMMGGGMMGGYR